MAKKFKDYLSDGMFENFIRTGTRLQKFLGKKGIEVTPRTTQRYIKGDYVPEFDMARKIMDALNVDVSDEDLRIAIRTSEATHRQKYKMTYTMTIKAKNLSDTITDEEEIMKKFEERFHASEGDKKPHFSSYVEALIKADIDHNILDNYR